MTQFFNSILPNTCRTFASIEETSDGVESAPKPFIYFDICCHAVNRVLNFTDTDADLERYFFVLVITFCFLFFWFFHLFLNFHLSCHFSIAYHNFCPCSWYVLWYGNAVTIKRHIFFSSLRHFHFCDYFFYDFACHCSFWYILFGSNVGVICICIHMCVDSLFYVTTVMSC